jgi:two-component system LytT family response regulator
MNAERMKMRTLIVDDEPLAREGIAIALQGVDDIEIVGTCADGPSAVRSIRELDPDLVFLDIKMPGLDGFGVIEQLAGERTPAVVFLTAYEEHALRAFRVHAVDYLLKPVDGDELRGSLDRARQRTAREDATLSRDRLRGLLKSMADSTGGKNAPERIAVRTGGRLRLLDPAEIVWVEAGGDYVTLHTAEKDHLVRDSISNWQTRLFAHGFRRIHRSTLVKLTAVRELVADDSGDGRAVLRDGSVLRVSRTYRNALYTELNPVRG